MSIHAPSSFTSASYLIISTLDKFFTFSFGPLPSAAEWLNFTRCQLVPENIAGSWGERERKQALGWAGPQFGCPKPGGRLIFGPASTQLPLGTVTETTVRGDHLELWQSALYIFFFYSIRGGWICIISYKHAGWFLK